MFVHTITQQRKTCVSAISQLNVIFSPPNTREFVRRDLAKLQKTEKKRKSMHVCVIFDIEFTLPVKKVTSHYQNFNFF
jgi:hypothetical protein